MCHQTALRAGDVSGPRNQNVSLATADGPRTDRPPSDRCRRQLGKNTVEDHERLDFLSKRLRGQISHTSVAWRARRTRRGATPTKSRVSSYLRVGLIGGELVNAARSGKRVMCEVFWCGRKSRPFFWPRHDDLDPVREDVPFFHELQAGLSDVVQRPAVDVWAHQTAHQRIQEVEHLPKDAARPHVL